jgi:hypothetical protein
MKGPKEKNTAQLGVDEHQEQVALFRWADLQRVRWHELELMHAIPNGGRRDAVTGGKLKAEGVKAGVPDLCLPVAKSGYHGLYIEPKTSAGKASIKQLQWFGALAGQGYRVSICRGWLEASRLITDYLKSKSKERHEQPPTRPRLGGIVVVAAREATGAVRTDQRS